MYIHMMLPNTSQCTILTLKVIKGHLRSKKKKNGIESEFNSDFFFTFNDQFN